MSTERNQVGDNLFNQGLKDAKEQEDKHSKKYSKNEQQEMILKVGLW
jgi:hypothetical protein